MSGLLPETKAGLQRAAGELNLFRGLLNSTAPSRLTCGDWRTLNGNIANTYNAIMVATLPYTEDKVVADVMTLEHVRKLQSVLRHLSKLRDVAAVGIHLKLTDRGRLTLVRHATDSVGLIEGILGR